MNGIKLKAAIEALLFASPSPLNLNKMSIILEVPKKDLREPLYNLMEDYEKKERGVIVREVAGGYKIFTRPEFSPFIGKLGKNRKRRLSRPALETVAIIAYRQPITRQEIEKIRGVEVKEILHTLIERKLIKIVGRKKEIGHPLMYGTTDEFLRYFGFKSLDELPKEEELLIKKNES